MTPKQTPPPSGRLRRWAGVVRRQLWQGLQVIDPIRLLLPRTPKNADVAVACVYRNKNVSTVRRIVADLPSSTVVRLWNLDEESPADLADLTAGNGRGHRFELLNRLIADIPPGKRRDGLVLIDDDVRFVVGDIGRLVAAAQLSGFDLYQPAQTAKSYANWKFLRRRALTFSRRTDFVEQGPLIGFSATAQQALLPLPEDIGMGWGVEVRWWATSLLQELALGIVDAVAVMHLEPTAQLYDRSSQEKTLDDELRYRGLTDMRALQRVLHTARLRPRVNAESRHPTSPSARPLPAAVATEPRVSVVVPTRNRRDQVVRLVRAIAPDPAVLEIIVVVDGGTDLTMTALSVLTDEFTKVRRIWQENMGAGAARQRGLERAVGDIVLFLDDDVEPMPTLAGAHLAVHVAEPGRLVVGSLPPGRTSHHTVHTVVDDIYTEAYEQCQREYVDDPGKLLFHLWAGNMSLDRATALRVGVGDEEFDKLFFEDRDFGQRLEAAGINGTFHPELRAVHHHVGTLRGYLRDSIRQGHALVVLRRRYPSQVPDLTAGYISGRFPVPATVVVAATMRSPRGAGVVVCGSLLVLSYLTGYLRMWTLQRPLVVLLRRAGQASGVGARRRVETGYRSA